MRLENAETNKLREVARAHNLRFVILHGSHTKGAVHAGSDVDVAIVGRSPISFDEYLKLYGKFAEVFGDSRECELDLKTLHGVDPLFRYQVVRDGTLLFGDPTDYEEFKAFAYRDYMDSYDLRELEAVLLEKSIHGITERYAR